MPQPRNSTSASPVIPPPAALPDAALHTNAKNGKKTVDGIPIMADGFPDSRKVSNVFDFMKLLTTTQWDQSRPAKEKVDCYLYRTDPPIPWAKEPGLNAYVDKIFQPIDEDWIGMNWGGGEFRVRMVRGLGEDRGDLYNQKVIISGAAKDLNFLADERRKARGGAKDTPTPVAAPVPVSAATDGLGTVERIVERFFNEEKLRRESFDTGKEFAAISEAQRQVLTRPETASGTPTMLQFMEMMERTRAETRKETMEMMERLMKRDAPVAVEQPKSLFDSLKEAIAVAGLIRGQGTGGEVAEAATPPSFIQTVMEGAPKVVEAVSGAMDRFNTLQRNERNKNPQPGPIGRAAIEVPAGPTAEEIAWDQMRAAGARMIVRMFPAPDAEYEEHGYDCADLMHGAMPDVARWFYEHLANDNRPADPVTDPILMPIVASPHVIEFAKDFARYFTEETPAPAAGSTEKEPANG